MKCRFRNWRLTLHSLGSLLVTWPEKSSLSNFKLQSFFFHINCVIYHCDIECNNLNWSSALICENTVRKKTHKNSTHVFIWNTHSQKGNSSLSLKCCLCSTTLTVHCIFHGNIRTGCDFHGVDSLSRNGPCWNWPWCGVSLPNVEGKTMQRDSAAVEQEAVVQGTVKLDCLCEGTSRAGSLAHVWLPTFGGKGCGELYLSEVVQSGQGCLFYKHLHSRFWIMRIWKWGLKKLFSFIHFYRKLGLKDHTQKMCHFIMLPGHLNFFKCQI